MATTVLGKHVSLIVPEAEQEKSPLEERHYHVTGLPSKRY
jgi:hypothetical protein